MPNEKPTTNETPKADTNGTPKADTNGTENTLKSQVDKARNGAIVVLRQLKVNEILEEMTTVKNGIKLYKDNVESYIKRVKRAEYAVTKLDEANPDYEELLEEKTAMIKETKECLISAEKDLEKEEKAIAETLAKYDKKIERLQSGEAKMNKEQITELTSRKLTQEYLNA